MGDVRSWYAAFLAFAESMPKSDGPFHGPHIAEAAGIEQVMEALDRLAAKHGDELAVNPLPTAEQLRAAVTARSAGRTDDRSGTDHSGSPMHNFWHWCHG